MSDIHTKTTEKSCYLFGAGEVYGFTKLPNKSVYTIAVDGGYVYTSSHGIAVDMVIGDFDSLGAPPKGECVHVLPVEKDDTDMLAALKIGLESGCTKFHIFGGTGGRIDHTLANIQCLAYLSSSGAQGYLYEEAYILTMLQNGEIALPRRERGHVSVFCFGGEAHGVTLTGLQYPLCDAALTNTFPIGVSNAFIGESAMIRVTDGTLLVCWQREAL